MRSLLTARALACAAAALAACTPNVESELAAVEGALLHGDLPAIEKHIHPAYSDARGDKARLLADLKELFEVYGTLKVGFFDLDYSRVPRARIPVIGRTEVLLEGRPSLKLTGPLDLELVKDGETSIRSGLLEDLRDIRALLLARVAALEANDPKAYGALLHPDYRDGDLDRDGAIARLEKELPGVRVRCEIVHHLIDVRGPKAHVDERYLLTVGETELPERVGRLTLERSAGRWRFISGLFAVAPPPDAGR